MRCTYYWTNLPLHSKASIRLYSPAHALGIETILYLIDLEALCLKKRLERNSQWQLDPQIAVRAARLASTLCSFSKYHYHHYHHHHHHYHYYYY